MNALARPPEPCGWATHPQVLGAQAELARKVQAGESLRRTEDFPPLWSELNFAGRSAKEHFEAAQRLICGYCGDKLTSAVPPLEHYRPVSEATRQVDPTSPGQERPELTRLQGRRLLPAPPHRPGYWWTAYAWENFIAACERCNKWKTTLFPLAADMPPAPTNGEVPLLLNAFELGPGGPGAHLEYDEQGQIRERTPQGQATIDTCGLDRVSLATRRRMHLQPLLWLMEDVARHRREPDADPEGARGRARTLWEAGQWDQPFAGLVRSVTEQRGISWAELEALATLAT